MDKDLLLKGKYTFRVGRRKLITVKKPAESMRHVVMKALLWALYLPDYPRMRVEVPIGFKYKPDLVETGSCGPRFWAEAGSVGTQKLRRIFKRFPQAHFALAAWGRPMGPLKVRVVRHIRGLTRKAPIDVIVFPDGSDSRFIDEHGSIRIVHDDLEWLRIP
jgi:hypothetical protein